MAPENFCYWLQGYFEIGGGRALDADQVAMIQEHLQLVFNKATEPTRPAEPTSRTHPWIMGRKGG